MTTQDEKNTGGPAFPHVADIVQMQGNSAIVKSFTQNGMTLRDYFAAKAMQTYMMQEFWNPDTYQIAASSAYRVADAMLKAREQ